MLVDIAVYDKCNNLLLLTKVDITNPGTVIIYIGGMLSDMMHPKFVFDMADKMHFASFVQPTLRSHPFFGLWSLADDAEDIERAIEYVCNNFRGKLSKDMTIDTAHGNSAEYSELPKIILLGHSTGCQSVLHYLNTRLHSTRITCAIFLGPVSDREYEESVNPNLSYNLELAQNNPEMTFLHFNSPVKAQRYISLFTKYGDDDLFSSDLPNKFFTTLNKSGTPLHFLVMKDDEYMLKSNVDCLKLVNNADVRVIGGDHVFGGGVDEMVGILGEIVRKYH